MDHSHISDAGSEAPALASVLQQLLPQALPIGVRAWDGSTAAGGASGAVVDVRSPDALRRLMWAPNELGFGRAYVAGDLDVDGNLYEVLAARDSLQLGEPQPSFDLGARGWLRVLRLARRAGVLGRPLPAPREESRLRGRRHSRARDAAAVSFHYDISNDFYRLLLGPTMTYSCAFFEHDDSTLDEAQEAKYGLICRKLGLRPGMRLLDVGCGWGGMVLHAAAHYGVDAVGVTLSRQQAELAELRVAQLGLTGRVQIRVQDYREIVDGPFDAISSIGMFEHVGLQNLAEYFDRLRTLLRPGGRLLNHGISRPSGRQRWGRHSFIDRYVFPDGELHEVGTVVSAMQAQGFEVRDVESLREHYARTLHAWSANLDAGWDEAQLLIGVGRARVWRLYVAAAALNFEAARSSIHQVLAVNDHPDGRSEMPPTRAALLLARESMSD
ncbi:MAG: cyclopropane-fatty-acyl-phospholipid synthase family protein [Ilumatobacteraceae bacterium]